MTAADLSATPLLDLLQLEKEIRHAETEAAFRYVAVNRTRSLLPYRMAALLRRTSSGRWRPVALSDVAVVERDAPFARWLAKAAAAIATAHGTSGAAPADATSLPEGPDRAEWAEFAAAHALWLPLVHPDGTVLGALLLFRDTPCAAPEMVLAERLADTYAHAWKPLAPRQWKRRMARRTRRALQAGAVAALVAVLLIPVRQTALAPGRVAPKDPVVVSAPLDGVIETFHVEPNTRVEAGTPLFSLEDAALRSTLAVAEEELAVAQAELRTATQGAFRDAEGRAKIAMLSARVNLKRAERDRAAERLSRVTVRAERDGLAVFRDANDWEGRPVKTGERVLVIADPAAVELRLHLPVDDAIALEPGAGVRLFLDVAPLNPLEGRLLHAGYEPELSDDQILGYRVTAALDAGQSPPRLGLRGTARIDGPSAPLALHLFRRPLAAVRQFFGL